MQVTYFIPPRERVNNVASSLTTPVITLGPVIHRMGKLAYHL